MVEVRLPLGSLGFPRKAKSLPIIVVELITDKLLAGEFRPGDQLPTEMEFAHALGVGRGSIREAVKMLSSLGIIEIRRGEGTFVVESPPPSIIDPLVLGLIFEERSSRELVELRILLETGAAQLVIGRMTEEDLVKLEGANELLRQESAKDHPDPQKLLDLDLNFHTAVNELSGNRLLAKIYRSVWILFFSSVKESIRQDPFRAYENHALIIRAIRSQDPRLVHEAVSRSLKFWSKFTS
jgi:DNA-binding FadR family transcriptional regulator